MRVGYAFVEGGCRSIHPDFGRVGKAGDCRAEETSRSDARLIDSLAVGRGGTAVDGASGQVDANVGAFQVLGPWAELNAVPVNGLPLSRVRAACEHGDVMAALLEVAGQQLANLSAAAGKDDAERSQGDRNCL